MRSPIQAPFHPVKMSTLASLLILLCLAASPSEIRAATNQPPQGRIQVISALPPDLTTPQPRDTVSMRILTWASKIQSRRAQPGAETMRFSFPVTNVSPADVLIFTTSTSCGCTVAKLPTQPWKLAPAATGQIEVTMDLRGKQGLISKEVTVFTSKGNSLLRVEAIMDDTSPSPPDSRMQNQALAMKNRQAVFQGDCAGCHATPAVGKLGKELYQAACALCHESQHRAPTVPDLHRLKAPATLDFWITWITHGKAGSMMPAFARDQGGPLSPEQVSSLADYLTWDFPIVSDTK